MNKSGHENAGKSSDSHRPCYAPKKFIFETSKSQPSSRKEVADDDDVLKVALETEKVMPYVFSFPEPLNYRESYSKLVGNVLEVYNYVRELVAKVITSS